MSSQTPLRLLSLDGGGVRGLATLLILDNLTKRINPTNPPKPCDFFDLIGGTSTGGLIAIMLGRLEMDVQSCINAYIELSNRVFREKLPKWRVISGIRNKLLMKEKFNSGELEKAIKETIESQGRNEDLMFRDETNPNPKCKVFVCVTRGENAQNTSFRSYSSLRGTNPNCKTWEACRATSAASTFFDPITIGELGTTYVDGATGRNNPVNEVLAEARDIWPDLDQRLQCLVSIGTGQTNFSKFGQNLAQVIKTLKDISTSTERTAEEFLRSHQDLKKNHGYFRFNVIRGLEEVGLEENAKMAEMLAATSTYLESEGVRVEMEDCVKSLRDPFVPTPLQRKPTIFAIHQEFIEKYDDIRKWLSPPIYQSDYENIKAQRETNTCQWIFEREEFKTWRNHSSRFLWIHGKPGCGKSVIASTIVETIDDRSVEPMQTHIGYVFCDKRDESKHHPLAMMKILVWQIISREDLRYDQEQMVLAAWKSAANPEALSNCHLNDTERIYPWILFGLFEKLIAPYNSCKIILDGLDECESPGGILRRFIDLTRASPHIQLLLVSQDVSPIREVLDSSSPVIQITPDDTHNDLVQYVDAHLPQILSLQKDLNTKIRRILLGNAEGMFLWVRLAIAQLEVAVRSANPTEARLLAVVQALPKSLEDSFAYILERILEDAQNGLETDKVLMRKEKCLALEYVLGSFRPLKIHELQAALKLSSLEVDGTFTASRMDNNEESVIAFKNRFLPLCTPLLSVQSDDTVTIVHSSFKVFMETTARKHHIFQTQFQTPAMIHSMLATASIRYLQSNVFSDFVKFTEGYEQCTPELFPFKKYATQYWWLHLDGFSPGGEDDRQELHKLVMDFLGSSQAITWLESLFSRVASTSATEVHWRDFMIIQSKVNDWLGPSRIQNWGIQLARECVRMREARERKGHPGTLRAMGILADAYYEAGQLKEAEKLLEKLLQMRKKELGKEHPDTLETIGNLATVHYKEGRLKEAEKLLSQVVEVRKKVLGKEHRDTLWAMGNLAVIYYSHERLKEAELLQVEVLEDSKRVLGRGHPDTLKAMGNLATTYHQNGRFREAQELDEQVLEATKKIFGEDHPDTLQAMSNLATVYSQFGRLKETEGIELQVVQSRKKVLGSEHPDTLQAMGYLAATYRQAGRLEEAKELQLQVLATTTRVFGKEHLVTLRAMDNLAATYHQHGRLKKAIKLQVQVLKARRSVLGKEHPDTLRAMGHLAMTYLENRQMKKAEELQVQVLRMREKTLGSEHPDTLRAMGYLATTYCESRRLKEAEELQVKVLRVTTEILSKEHLDTLRYMHLDTLRAMSNLATKYYQDGCLKKAEMLLVQVLEKRENILGKEHLKTLEVMGSLAKICHKEGRLKEAEAFEVQALERRNKISDNSHQETLLAIHDLVERY